MLLGQKRLGIKVWDSRTKANSPKEHTLKASRPIIARIMFIETEIRETKGKKRQSLPKSIRD